MNLLQQAEIRKAAELLNSASRHEQKIENGIGLSDREIRSYSPLNAIRVKYDNIRNGSSFRDCMEAEIHDSLVRKLGCPANDGIIYIPQEVLYRDLTAAGSGGYLVATGTGGSFIEILRNRSVVNKLGATRLPGQTRNVAMPKQSGSATHYWLANEAAAPTETQQTFTQIAMTPKTVSAYTEISRQLLLQSNPAAEDIIMSDLAGILATAKDAAAINGNGSNEPTGLLNTSGIGSVSGTSLGYAGLIEFQQDVSDANALINPATTGYVTTPAVAGLLKGRQRFTGSDSPLWQGSLHTGTIEGVQALATKQVLTATMIYGDWSQLLIAEWGNLSIEVNPFTNFAAGIIGIRGMWSIDIGIRHAESFSVATSIT